MMVKKGKPGGKEENKGKEELGKGGRMKKHRRTGGKKGIKRKRAEEK